ncbi:MAG: DNA repair protein RecO [Nitrospiraceae bacterium]|nr:DNA repair protein RecO [Nitrospiraceae bacterium]
MLQRTEGIVLRTNSFGEADLIVTYLTADHGILKTFAKSPRKIKSRFGSSLEPLTCSKIAFWGKEDASLPRLTQSDIIHSFEAVRSSLQCFLRASEVIELILHLLPERDASRNAYALLMTMLRSFEQECGNRLLLLYYKIRLLKIAGYLPKIDACGRCGGVSRSFFLSHGTVLCEGCSRGTGGAFLLSAGAVSLFTNLVVWTSSKIDRIRPSERQMDELSRLIDEHVRQVTERNLKTREFRV